MALLIITAAVLLAAVVKAASGPAPSALVERRVRLDEMAAARRRDARPKGRQPMPTAHPDRVRQGRSIFRSTAGSH